MLSCCWLCLCCVHVHVDVATFNAFFLMSFSYCTFGLDAKGLEAKLALLGTLLVEHAYSTLPTTVNKKPGLG